MSFLSLRSTGDLRRVRFGRERLPAASHRPRHRHLCAYAIVVVAGCFEQVSYAGRVVVRAGDILVQPTLDSHANTLKSVGAEILRLPWAMEQGVGGMHSLNDVDAVIQAAEIDPVRAAQLAFAEVARHGLCRARERDWPDILAAALVNRSVESIAAWATTNGLARETVSRGFRKAFGVCPMTFRAEMRARTAWLKTIVTTDRFAEIAAETGFADQAHMTRAVRALTGSPPGVWRTQLVRELANVYPDGRSADLSGALHRDWESAVLSDHNGNVGTSPRPGRPRKIFAATGTSTQDHD